MSDKKKVNLTCTYSKDRCNKSRHCCTLLNPGFRRGTWIPPRVGSFNAGEVLVVESE